MKKLRVLVANQPRLMRDLVRVTISEQPDIEVLGEIEDESKITDVVAELKPDFVIVSLDRPDERPAICDYLFANHPFIKVLAVAPEYDSGVCCWLDVHSEAIESSQEGILNALRGRLALPYQRIM